MSLFHRLGPEQGRKKGKSHCWHKNEQVQNSMLLADMWLQLLKIKFYKNKNHQILIISNFIILPVVCGAVGTAAGTVCEEGAGAT